MAQGAVVLAQHQQAAGLLVEAMAQAVIVAPQLLHAVDEAVGLGRAPLHRQPPRLIDDEKVRVFVNHGFFYGFLPEGGNRTVRPPLLVEGREAQHVVQL